MKNCGIILAGGIGQRFGSNIPKQYTLINGKEVISYSINALKNAECIDSFVVVLDKNEYERGVIKEKYGTQTTLGGATRNESIQNGIEFLKKHEKYYDNVIILDAARPLITSNIIDNYMNLLVDNDYVITCSHLTDALFTYLDQEIPNRKDCFLASAPEAYRLVVLKKYFVAESPIDFPALQMPKFVKGFQYFDFRPNNKVTYPEDAKLVEFLLSQKK